MVVSNGRGKTAKDTARPFVFPSLKVDGSLWTQEVVIENEGQGILAAQQEAAKVIRQRRAAMKAKEIPVPVKGDSEVSKDPNSGDSAVAVSPVMSPKAIGPAVQEWLALHLPSSESLMSAAASMASLTNIENRVRDLVTSFQADLDSFKAGFTSWFASVQSEWTAIVSNANDLLVAWGAKVDEVDTFTAALKTDLEAYVATLRGPKGNVGSTGMAGAATTVVDRLPKGKGVDFTRSFLGRDAVVGDICIDATTDMRYGWRWDGQGWERGPAMVSLQVRDVRVNTLDAAPRITAPITIVRPGSGGGGAGGEALLANRMGIGGSTVLADSSNWGGIHDPLSGVLELDLRALNGTMQGRSAVCIAAFTWDGSANDKWQEYALLGDLTGAIQVSLSIQRGNASLPAAGGLSPITIPAGSQALRIFATIQYVPGAGTAGATQFSVRGSINWNFEADGRPLDATQSGKQPLWLWS